MATLRRQPPGYDPAMRLVAAACLLVLLAACAPAESGNGAAVAPATPPEVLDFTATTVDGGTLQGAELAGTDVALWFWAPWCGVCNREAPAVAEVANEMGDRVRIVGVAGRDTSGPMRDFVARHDLQGLTHVDDVDGDVWERFGIVGQPAWVFVDGETGEVQERLGALDADGLRDRLAALSA